MKERKITIEVLQDMMNNLNTTADELYDKWTTAKGDNARQLFNELKDIEDNIEHIKAVLKLF